MNRIKAIAAPQLRKPKLYPVVLCYALIVVVMTTGLLFKSDDLVEAIVAFGVGGGRFGVLVAVLVAAAGVLSLPYLLRMQVSPLMRATSFAASFVAPFGWLLAAWWIELNLGQDYGFLLVVAAHLALLLALLAAWVIGLPLKPLKKHQ